MKNVGRNRNNEHMAVCEYAMAIIFALAFLGYLVCSVLNAWE